MSIESGEVHDWPPVTSAHASRGQPDATCSLAVRPVASIESAVRYDSLTVRIYDDVAVLRGIADNTGTFRGIPFSGKIRYTRVFVRRDGRWQAVAMQQTALQ